MENLCDKRYPTVQQKYALILQNRKNDVNEKKPFLNINDTHIDMTTSNDANLLDLYAHAHQLNEKKKGKSKDKLISNVNLAKNPMIDNLTVRRSRPLINLGDPNLTYEEKKHSGERKSKLKTLPTDLSAAITLGQKMLTKYNKRSRMTRNNLFTSSTTPTGNAKNSLKTTINNSMNQNVFKVNKSFLNKIKKMKS